VKGGAGVVAFVAAVAGAVTGAFGAALSVSGGRMTGGEAVAVGVVAWLAVCAAAVAWAAVEVGGDPDA
jgi:hypothetical protein